MIDTYILSLVRVEGLEDIYNSECSIKLDGTEISTCPLSTLPVNFTIASPGVITMTMHDKDSRIPLASIAFQSSLLNSEWFYWLPLFLGSNNFLSSLPIKITQPRVLIGVNKEIQTETSEQNEDKLSYLERYNGYSKNQETYWKISSELTCYKKDDSEHLIQYYQNLVKELENDIHRQKNTCKQIVKEFKAQITELKEQVEFEKKYRIDMQEKFEHCIGLYEAIRKREEKFFESLHKKSRNFIFEIQTLETISITPLIQNQANDDKISPSVILNDTLNFPNTIERKVYETLDRIKLAGLLKRTKDMNFMIGAKTICLCIKQGEVICKNGTSLEKYIFKNCKSEIEDFLRIRACPGIQKSSSSRSPIVFSKSPGFYTQRISKY
ncbi:hypothetical protein SteCoe_24505 [Stentor coeruleus]|uniref:Uncharacterized protein n=1 Tax=Stentor coeruleus TaxID=5963 RepID=A0A1R2BHF3_9CILI|nr:hypothetical protein SteCoe_24505 [Stentor coeruleus]